MTRTDELKSKVDELFRCESFGYAVSKADVLELLQHVEREVWNKVNARMAMVVEDKDTLHEWVRAQQKELG